MVRSCVTRMAIAALLLQAIFACTSHPHPARSFVLWAWERPEDLRFLTTHAGVSVAWFAGTVAIGSDYSSPRPRVQALRLDPGTANVPVVRIALEGSGQRWDDRTRTEVLRGIGRIVDLPRADALQIDFDAPASARAFYRALLGDLRKSLPPASRLSMTALASWCLGDGWIRDLPVHEAVPMVFRLGPNMADVEERLASLEDWPVTVCSGAVGLATDEPVRWVRGADRIYLFSTTPWTETMVEKAMERLNR